MKAAVQSLPFRRRSGRSFWRTAFGQARQNGILVNFLKLLCERGILGEYAGCCEEFTRRYNVDHNIADGSGDQCGGSDRGSR